MGEPGFYEEWAASGDPRKSAHVAAARRLRSEGGAAAPPATTNPMDCVWLGQPTGDLVECPTCSGTVMLKVFACQVFETTHYRQCQTCAERLPRGA